MAEDTSYQEIEDQASYANAFNHSPLGREWTKQNDKALDGIRKGAPRAVGMLIPFSRIKIRYE